MKTLLVILLYLGVTMTCFAQDSQEKKYYDSLNNTKVKECKIANETFSIGDTITIGTPMEKKDKFTFLKRKIEYYDIDGKTPIENILLPDSWVGLQVVISGFYLAKNKPASTCVAEFIIVDDNFGWIMLSDAIKNKELATHNALSY